MSVFKTVLVAGVAAVALGIACGSASAGTITFSGSKASSTTNYATAVGFSKFDPALGTLISISFNLAGTITGSLKAESEDNAPTNVVETFSANIALQRPDNSQLVVIFPSQTITDNFTAFDGIVDYAGTSGAKHLGLSVSSSNSATSNSASDLSLFTGTAGSPGLINLTFSAQGTSSGSGSGNLDFGAQTAAAANADVIYTYTDAPPTGVPEPATMALLGASLVGIGVARRRRNV